MGLFLFTVLVRRGHFCTNYEQLLCDLIEDFLLFLAGLCSDILLLHQHIVQLLFWVLKRWYMFVQLWQIPIINMGIHARSFRRFTMRQCTNTVCRGQSNDSYNYHNTQLSRFDLGNLALLAWTHLKIGDLSKTVHNRTEAPALKQRTAQPIRWCQIMCLNASF